VIAERLGVQPSSPAFRLAQLVHADLVTQRCLSRQLYSVSVSGVSTTALGQDSAVPAPRRDRLQTARKQKLSDPSANSGKCHNQKWSALFDHLIRSREQHRRNGEGQAILDVDH
jgi:hypothetical protein